jgi:hypothetical protein
MTCVLMLAVRVVAKVGMLMDDVARCAGPGCEQPLARQSTGRPARYCSPRCRKAAQRKRDRQAEAERWLAAAAADLPAAIAQARRTLEAQIDRAGDLAAAVVDLAAGGNDRDELISVLEAYRGKAIDVEIAARIYFSATEYAVRLAGRTGADVADGQSGPAQTSGRPRPRRGAAARPG